MALPDDAPMRVAVISPITTLWLTLITVYAIHAAFDCLPELTALRTPQPGRQGRRERERRSFSEGEREMAALGSAAALAGGSPGFLPMVAWFSGTSADIVKTGVQLAISLSLFRVRSWDASRIPRRSPHRSKPSPLQGRFDMRTMQSATAACTAERLNEPPREGDGYTYEQFASRDELWFDFCADTGDGGNATYTGAGVGRSGVMRSNQAADGGAACTL